MKLENCPSWLGTVDFGASGHDSAYRLLIRVDHGNAGAAVQVVEEGRTFTCILGPAKSNGIWIHQLVLMSLVIACQSETNGGVLLHGALAERDGHGVILAGPGGVGKTTASERLRSPWRSLSDDVTLVVRDSGGVYRAHPWPTWSRFIQCQLAGGWDVQQSMPIKGIFFLEQAAEDRANRLGMAQSVGLLVESTEQVFSPMMKDMEKDRARALRLQRFDNIGQLVKAVPCYRLCLSLEGTFWHEIERAVTESTNCVTT